MFARRLGEEDGDDQVPGECELKSLTVFRSQSIVVATEDFSTVFASWSIGNSESFDEGETCGKVDDRTTSVTCFEQALERRDGKGFGNAIFSRVSYQGAGGVVDTKISSSTVTAISVTSSSGAPGDEAPATMGYGQTFYTSHVNFRDGDDLQFSLPLLFHDPVGCLDEDIDLDVYGSAVVGYANSLGGNVTSVPAAEDADGALVVRERYDAIVLSLEALLDYVTMQAACDVGSEPVWTDAGYAICSDGLIVALVAPIPNVTTLVGGCPISVLPARFLAVGDFINGTFDSRLSQWNEHFLSVQTKILSQGVDASASLATAASPVVQTSTPVGFALPDANDSTEWVLILVVAVESLLVVFSALVSLAFSAPNGFKRRGSTLRHDWVIIFGSVFALAGFLVLGLFPVFVGWESEQEAADMAHNDVFAYTAETTVCGAASWQGDDTGLGQWCTALRTSSETLLVRSYASTFEGRYAGLAISAAVAGGALWMAYVLMKTLFDKKP